MLIRSAGTAHKVTKKVKHLIFFTPLYICISHIVCKTIRRLLQLLMAVGKKHKKSKLVTLRFFLIFKYVYLILQHLFSKWMSCLTLLVAQIIYLRL